MKYSRPVVAGIVLSAAALLIVVIGKLGSNGEAANGSTASSSAAGKSSASAPPSSAGQSSRTSRTREPSEPPDAKELKLLWARGRAQELLVALDQLSQHADAEVWQDVAPILIEQAATEGRTDVATYLLATADAAPAAVRREIYAAALDNRDEAVRDTARLELQNITGQVFRSGADAREWFASHPEAAPDDETEDQ